MHRDWEFRVPLFGADRCVRAWALVDEEDYWRVLGFRWCLTARGYAGRFDPGGPNRSSIKMHRWLLGLERGDGLQADHINRRRLDNRRENLRVIDQLGNMQNVSSLAGSSSKYRGVTWHSRSAKWVAQCKIAGKTHHLGTFVDEEKAAEAARLFRLANMPGAVD